MKTKVPYRFLCSSLVISLLLSAGCTSQEAPAPSSPTPDSVEESVLPTPESAGPEVLPSTEPEKLTVTDFYEMVNGEMLSAIKVDQYTPYYFSQETYNLVDEGVREIITNTDPATLAPEAGLYKLLFLYQQLEDREYCNQLGLSSLKDHLKKIDKVKDLNALYDLYKDPEYALFNRIITYRIQQTNRNGITMVEPQTLFSLHFDDIAQQKQDLQAVIEEVGYSQSRAKEIVDHTFYIEGITNSLYTNVQGQTLYYLIDDGTLDKAGVEVPIMDILESLHAIPEYRQYYSYTEYSQYLKQLYTKENLPKLRDHLLASSILTLGQYTTDTLREKITAFMGRDTEMDSSYYNQSLIIALAPDVLTDAYTEKYIGEETLQSARDLVDETILSMRELITDTEWLSIHGKELAKRKVNHLKIVIGTNQSWNDLGEVTLGTDPLENALLLRISNAGFQSTFLERDPEGRVAGYDMLAANAWYDSTRNAIIIPSGWLSSPLASGSASREERLAYLGFIIAHEISHAYDTQGSEYDEDGDYNPWMKEEEAEKYEEKAQKIADFFNGMKTASGLTLSGRIIKDETFSDLMAMDCCLRMLEKYTDPDYDLFFRTYARCKAEKTTVLYATLNLQYDPHLPGEERVNYILGQFDKFYEIYNVPEDSPYFVPKQERLSAF